MQLVGEFIKKSPITLSFPQTGAQSNLKNPGGGLMSAFSTYGPTFDMYFKPAVSAPGGNIMSTFVSADPDPVVLPLNDSAKPLALGGFSVQSGTSMATPFTAGAAALILQARGKGSATALGMRDLLQSTAASISRSHTDGDLYQTASQQGAGLIQVYDAIKTKTIVTPGQLTLNDTEYFNQQ
jgi:subtilisin family serine protease